MELKSREPQNAHLGPLLNVHTRFQLPNSVWKGTVIFQCQKGGEILISPLLFDLGG